MHRRAHLGQPFARMANTCAGNSEKFGLISAIPYHAGPLAYPRHGLGAGNFLTVLGCGSSERRHRLGLPPSGVLRGTRSESRKFLRLSCGILAFPAIRPRV